jgi:putative nucleotidyltransferase with HDIG domain
LGGAVGAHSVNPLKQRGDLIRAMTVVGSAQIIIGASASAMSSSTVRPVLESAAWAGFAAIVATSIFWFGVAILEKGFGLTSDWSLLELCSPDHPLLRELTMRAPGTYAHSVMVGNLAENAAREVGANAVLARAMAYFHDIGKMNRPSYFIENQRGDNLHDELPAALSARIISEHVKEGLELARQYRLPRVIRDGIQQHHGTSLIAFFYGKALQTQAPTEELESSFRYEGPKPQTREAAILHLADSVEALSRVIPRGSSEELEIAIRRVIEERRADGQLDECDLTFRDLRVIERSFLRSLGALRHERVEYPEDIAAHVHAKNSHYDLEQLRTAYPDEHPPHGA